MKKSFLIVIIAILLLLGLGFILRKTLIKPASAGLQVKSVPASTVFLDGKQVGQTPFEDKKLSAGEITLRLVPEGTTVSLSPWETKIKLVGGTQTIVNREFGETEASSAGETMTLEKIADKKAASLSIISLPDSALIEIDGQSKGFTPLNLDKQDEGEREIAVSASGFAKRTIRVKLLAGYKLILNVKLAEEKTAEVSPTITPTGSPTKITPGPSEKPTPTVKPKGISVRVLNGSGVTGVAGKVADFLKSLGYAIAGTGNAPNYNYATTEISTKKSQTLSTLQADLAGKYEVGSASATLSATESADAVVIVGKK